MSAGASPSTENFQMGVARVTARPKRRIQRPGIRWVGSPRWRSDDAAITGRKTPICAKNSAYEYRPRSERRMILPVLLQAGEAVSGVVAGRGARRLGRGVWPGCRGPVDRGALRAQAKGGRPS